MLTGFFSGVSGVHYNQQKLDVVSNNLSNADTTGFRRSLMVIRSREENPQTKWVDSDVLNRSPKFYGTERTGVYKIYKDTGRLQETGNQFDIAIPPEHQNSFFSVKRLYDTSGEVFYTRNGSLSFGPEDPNNPDSPTVLYLGGHIALGEDNQPMEIDPSAGKLGIGNDGTINQNGEIAGALPTYRLNKSPDPTNQQSANLQLLSQQGDSLYKIPENLRDEFHPSRMEIGRSGSRLIVQGVRESSNVNPVEELIHMMDASGGFKNNISALGMQVESLQKLFQTVRT